ncbi:hypothetical protein G195_011092 [Phytophthora kernoviae 00238/432]|uniref:LisH domain-containing protein n=1 Tax=Phytophthora kernoviae 00238/432 TaxID=1284355 RepID=A0A8J4VZY3_9STRA|nr:hypothetical protein G195_011092 [Phytophthora kernoviae 00238/432]
MDFDPRCVGFEGRLHADGVTLEYVGRGNHDSDAACFRSRRTVAANVYDLDDFGELAEISDDESSDEVSEDDGVKQENGDINGSIAGGVGVLLNKFEDVDMEEIDGCVDEEKVLYPSISLHGVGECVRAVFGTEELQFDIAGFEQQVQKERQRALLEEREKRGAKENPSDIEQMDFKDEAAMNELVQDFFLHYGYENAYKTFESALTPSKRCRMSSDSMDIENGDGAEANGSCNMNEEEEEKHEDMELSGRHSSLYSPKKQHMRRSLSLRHEATIYDSSENCYCTAGYSV